MGYIKIFNRRILQTKSEQNPDTCLRNYTHTHTLVNRLVELSPVIELNLWNVLFSSLASKYGTRSTHMYIDSDDVRSTLTAKRFNEFHDPVQMERKLSDIVKTA